MPPAPWEPQAGAAPAAAPDGGRWSIAGRRPCPGFSPGAPVVTADRISRTMTLPGLRQRHMSLASITGHCPAARLRAGGPPGTVLGTRGATGPVTSPGAYRDHPEIWARAVAVGAMSRCAGCGAPPTGPWAASETTGVAGGTAGSSAPDKACPGNCQSRCGPAGPLGSAGLLRAGGNSDRRGLLRTGGGRSDRQGCYGTREAITGGREGRTRGGCCCRGGRCRHRRCAWRWQRCCRCCGRGVCHRGARRRSRSRRGSRCWRCT
jgi:hypothetical protein